MLVVVSLELQVFHEISWIYQNSQDCLENLPNPNQGHREFPWIPGNLTRQKFPREFPGILRIAICNFFCTRTQQPALCRSTTVSNRSETNCLLFESRITLLLVLNEYSILDCKISSSWFPNSQDLGKIPKQWQRWSNKALWVRCVCDCESVSTVSVKPSQTKNR